MLVPDLSIWRISDAAAATFPPLDWQPLTWKFYLKTFWKFYEETFSENFILKISSGQAATHQITCIHGL